MRSPCALFVPFLIPLLGLLGQAALYALAAPPATKAPTPPALAITHVTIIDCTGAAPQPGMTVVIRGERIVALDETNRLPVPEDAQVVNGRGMYLIPGLWD